MEFSKVINGVAIAIQAGVPVLLKGGVGDAKTSIVYSLLGQLCDKHHTSIVALHEPTEYGGFPVPSKDEQDAPVVSLLPVGWVKDLSRNRRRAGLFLDELSNGAPATRSAAMRGILDGTWGETHVENLSTVAAMNPPEIAESGYELSAPLANRFCHIDWNMPVEYWAEQLVGGFPEPTAVQLPEDWKRHQVEATAIVAAFSKAHPASIKAMPTSAAGRAEPFPSFRTFTMARDLYAACRAMGYATDHDTTVTLIAGCIGAGASASFLTYAKDLDLPDPEDLLKNPHKLKLPPRGDRAFAILTAVTAAVLANNTKPRWEAALEVCDVAVKQERMDVAAVSVRQLLQRANQPKGAQLPKSIDAFIPMLKQAGLMKARV